MEAIVYMVAGLSSRFFGRIKQLIKVNEKETLIEYSLNQALKAGFSKIVFIVGEKTEEEFKKLFRDNYKGVPVYYAFQSYDKDKRDKPLGTVDALCSARELLNCKFVVCNGDDIYGEGAFQILYNHFQNKEGSATLGYKFGNVIPEKGEVNRGIFEIDNGKVKSIKEGFGISMNNLEEKGLTPETLCSMNIFALTPEILRMLDSRLENFKKEHENDRKIECLLPDELGRLILEKKIEMELYPTDERWFGVTNPEDENKIREELKIK